MGGRRRARPCAASGRGTCHCGVPLETPRDFPVNPQRQLQGKRTSNRLATKIDWPAATVPREKGADGRKVSRGQGSPAGLGVRHELRHGPTHPALAAAAATTAVASSSSSIPTGAGPGVALRFIPGSCFIPGVALRAGAAVAGPPAAKDLDEEVQMERSVKGRGPLNGHHQRRRNLDEEVLVSG